MKLYLAIPTKMTPNAPKTTQMKARIAPRIAPKVKARPNLKNMLKFVATKAHTCNRCGG